MGSSLLFASLRILLLFRAGAAVIEGHGNTTTAGLRNNVNYNHSRARSAVSALIVFGDSTADTGNNDYLPTLFKSNYPPYGRDFVDHKPTGRFCNGKLVVDFLVEALGLKETLPPYLDPNLSVQDFLTGVCFASAGTGYDNLTAHINSVIPLWKQVEYFEDYRGRLQDLVGENYASEIIRKAIFLSSIGSNDFLFNYFLLPVRRKQFTVEQYQDFLLEAARNFVEKLYGLGMRKLGVVGLPAIGCLPATRTQRQVISKGFRRDECVQDLNRVANTFNGKLQTTLASLNLRLPGVRIVYIDIYDVVLDITQKPAKYGFDVSDQGCCGTGLIETGTLCNEHTPFTCTDASKYVFWDSVHPSQKTYEIVTRLVLQRDIPNL